MDTWTPVDNSGATIPLSISEANYEQNDGDDRVFVQLNLTYPETSNTSVAKISLPVSQVANSMHALAVGYNTSGAEIYAQALNGNVKFYAAPNSTTALTNAALSGATINVSGFYFAS